MIYLAEQWPAEYRGKLLTLNFHGRRANVERLERAGSGYVGRHEPDILFAADPWFRGIDLGLRARRQTSTSSTGATPANATTTTASTATTGPDLRVTYGKPGAMPLLDLSKRGDQALVALHRQPNEWFVRQARRELAARAAEGDPLEQAAGSLRAILDEDPDPVRELRALWTLYVIGCADGPFLRRLLGHEHESIRAWAIRLLTDDWPIDTIFSRRVGTDVVPPPADLLDRLTAMARDDRSGLVRLVLASTLQRLPVDRRLPMAAALLSHAEDATDHNLPSLIWTGLIPVADADPRGPCRAGRDGPDADRRRVDRAAAGRGDRRAAGAGERAARGGRRRAAGQSRCCRRGLNRGAGRPSQGPEARGLGRLPRAGSPRPATASRPTRSASWTSSSATAGRSTRSAAAGAR